MKNIIRSEFLLSTFWTSWRYWVSWSACIIAIFFLGVLRTETDAELAFASFALVPVLFISWVGGRNNGLFIAVLAAAMWAVSDITSDRQFSASWIPWVNAITRLMTYSLVAILSAQIRLNFENEHERATKDVLTGLQNRRAFFEAVAGEIERSKRYKHSLAVIFLDLDNFKQLNDTKGHDVGDNALRATANALLAALRSSDRVARLGGDEFAALLPEIGYDTAVEAGRKISDAVHKSLQDFSPTGVSVGVAWFETMDLSLDAMLKAADQLMYEVKENGKGDMRSRRFSVEDERYGISRRAN